MILEYSITNTFSINEKQTISFEAVENLKDEEQSHYQIVDGEKILKLACLYGANASGKTKMAQALYFYVDFILSSFTDLKPNEPIHFTPFKFSSETLNKPGEFELVFYAKNTELNKNIRYKYNICLTSKSIVSESLYYAPKGQLKLIFERNESNQIKWGTDVTGAKKIIADMTRKNCSVISAGAQAKHPILKFLYDHLSERFKGIIMPYSNGLSGYIAKQIDANPVYKEKIMGLLTATDIGNISDIEVKSEIISDEVLKQFPQEIQDDIAKRGEKPKRRKLNLIHKYDQEYSLPFALESAGTKRMMELAAPLIDIVSSPSMLIIDELEASLHQELLELFIMVFLKNSGESQLLFTTHNQELLDSELLRDDEIWFCNKTNKGNSVYNSITDYKGVRKGVSRKKLYQADKFGALPNIDMSSLMELFDAKKDQ